MSIEWIILGIIKHCIRLFGQTKPRCQMYYDVLAEKVRYYKQNEEGVSYMREIMDKIKNEGRLEGKEEQKREMILTMDELSYSAEQISLIVKESVEYVAAIIKSYKNENFNPVI